MKKSLSKFDRVEFFGGFMTATAIWFGLFMFFMGYVIMNHGGQ